MNIDVFIGEHEYLEIITTMRMKSVTFEELLHIAGRNVSMGGFKYRKTDKGYLIGKQNAAQTTVQANEWGEPVEGVQIQLRADKQVWKVGETPILKADVHNTGKRDLYLPYCYFQAEVEVDGRSYRWTGPSNILRPDHGPYARQREDIEIYLHLHSWTAVGDFRQQLGLKPGRYVIRVAFYAKPDDGQPIRAVSNPVEIEIQPATQPPE